MILFLELSPSLNRPAPQQISLQSSLALPGV
jgi:hypothetical protein